MPNERISMSKPKHLIGLRSRSVPAPGRGFWLSVGAVSNYLRAVRGPCCHLELALAGPNNKPCCIANLVEIHQQPRATFTADSNTAITSSNKRLVTYAACWTRCVRFVTRLLLLRQELRVRRA
jgi:hypothetical protein